MSAIENADKLQELSYVDLRHLVTEKYNDYTGLQKAYRQSMITKEQIENLQSELGTYNNYNFTPDVEELDKEIDGIREQLNVEIGKEREKANAKKAELTPDLKDWQQLLAKIPNDRVAKKSSRQRRISTIILWLILLWFIPVEPILEITGVMPKSFLDSDGLFYLLIVLMASGIIALFKRAATYSASPKTFRLAKKELKEKIATQQAKIDEIDRAFQKQVKRIQSTLPTREDLQNSKHELKKKVEKQKEQLIKLVIKRNKELLDAQTFHRKFLRGNLIPKKYWGVLDKVKQYLDNGEATNWKEVTGLFIQEVQHYETVNTINNAAERIFSGITDLNNNIQGMQKMISNQLAESNQQLATILSSTESFGIQLSDVQNQLEISNAQISQANQNQTNQYRRTHQQLLDTGKDVKRIRRQLGDYN